MAIYFVFLVPCLVFTAVSIWYLMPFEKEIVDSDALSIHIICDDNDIEVTDGQTKSQILSVLNKAVYQREFLHSSYIFERGPVSVDQYFMINLFQNDYFIGSFYL